MKDYKGGDHPHIGGQYSEEGQERLVLMLELGQRNEDYHGMLGEGQSKLIVGSGDFLDQSR